MNYTEKYEKHHAIIKDLIELNRIHRQQVEETNSISAQMAIADYAMEFCSVHVGIGRRTGKTQFICSQATRHDLIVVANEDMRRQLFTGRTDCPVVAAQTVRILKNVPTTQRTIYIDEPALVFKKIPRRDLYAALAKNVDSTFVLLGA